MEQQKISELLIALLLTATLSGCAAAPETSAASPRIMIENGRDARGADPCRLLTDAQLTGLRLSGPGRAGPAVEGPRCEWQGGGTVLGLTLHTGGGGIVALARNSEPATRRVRVAGYPALETFTGRGEFCQYDVGIADAQVLMLAMEGPAPDSCSTLQAVVGMVIPNLPAVGRS
jgi:hypothetical protein